MKSHLLTLLVALSSFSCQEKQQPTPKPKSEPSATTELSETPSQKINLQAIAAQLDKTIGKRVQSTQMKGIETVSYFYDGPIDPVFNIITPIALNAGFKEIADPNSSIGEQEIAHVQSALSHMQFLENKTFENPNGELFSAARIQMKTESTDPSMQILTIQLINTKELKSAQE